MTSGRIGNGGKRAKGRRKGASVEKDGIGSVSDVALVTELATAKDSMKA